MVNIALENLMVIDIETVSEYKSFDQMDESWQYLWSEKISKSLNDHLTLEASYSGKAAIFAEFGKIICISIGFFVLENEHYSFRVKSIDGHDEKVLLSEFTDILNKWIAKKKQLCFCGHNIKEFDIPYISRRMIINGLDLPDYLDFQNKKPWDVVMIDTLQLWKFGDYKNYISLKLMAQVLKIESPKDDIDGSMVGKVYWEENDLKRIAVYCQKDVITVAQIILRFKKMPLLQQSNIIIV